MHSVWGLEHTTNILCRRLPKEVGCFQKKKSIGVKSVIVIGPFSENSYQRSVGKNVVSTGQIKELHSGGNWSSYSAILNSAMVEEDLKQIWLKFTRQVKGNS